MRYSILRRYCALATGALLASTITLHPATETTHSRLTFDSVASARSSGGRSGGGSFRSTPSRSTPSRSTPSNSSGSSGSNSNPSRNRYYNGGGGTVIVPVPVGPGVYNDPYRNNGYNNGYNNGQASTNNSGAGWIVGLILLGVSAIVVVGLVFLVVKAMRGKGASGRGEIDNDIVTVSKIQVALLAEARDIQFELTDLSLEIDTKTTEGLLQLVQEASLALLRMPENWSHVLAESQTVKSREEAEALFNKLSIAERSKFNVETLTNVGGRVSKRERFKPDPAEDPAAYIVVTLLVGTAHDKKLFEQVRTEEELSRALEQLASLPSDYLMTFELLWSPQESSDSLTYDELLTEYTDMIQL